MKFKNVLKKHTDSLKEDMSNLSDATDGTLSGGERVKGLAHTFFKRDQPRSVNNLYTGYGLTNTSKALAMGSVGVYGADAIFGVHENMKDRAREQLIEYEKNKEVIDIESPLASRADGVGYSTSKLVQNAQAQSDLVFAMHKTRQGGYL